MANIRLIVEALIGLSCKEVMALAGVLRDEYGISVSLEEVSQTSDKLEMFRETELRELTANNEKRLINVGMNSVLKKNKMFVPKKIGKPCKPYIGRRK